MTDTVAWEYAKQLSLDQYVNTSPKLQKLNLPPSSIDTPNWNPKSYVPTPKNSIEQLEPSLRQPFVDRFTGRHKASVGGAIETVPPEVERYQPTTPHRQASQPVTRATTTSPDRVTGANQPSSAAPPATPKTSGLKAGTRMTDPPPPASPRSSLGTNPTLQAKPTSMPVSPGLSNIAGVTTGIGTVLDFGFRVAGGQSIGQAAAGAAGGAVGTLGGIALGTAVAGPIGGFVGGMVGGFLGGRLADLLFPKPKSANPTVDPKTGLPPFKGGRMNIYYLINGKYYRHLNNDPNDVLNWTTHMPGLGPGFRIINSGGVQSLVNDAGVEIQINVYYGGYGTIVLHDAPEKFVITEVIPWDRNVVDTGGDLPPQPIRQDIRTPASISHPLNNSAPPSATPGAGALPAPNDYAPGGTAPKSNGTKRGDSPDWVSHAAPKGSPHPDHMPAPLLPPLLDFLEPGPKIQIIPDLLPIPDNVPTVVVNDDGSVSIFTPTQPLATTDLKPFSFDQSIPTTVTLVSSASNVGQSTTTPFTTQGTFSTQPQEVTTIRGTFSTQPQEVTNSAQPSSLPTTTKPTPQPDATKPVPANTAPPVPTAAKPENQQTTDKLEEITNKITQLTPLLTLLPSLTQFLNPGTTPGTPSSPQTPATPVQLPDDIKKQITNIENNTKPDAIKQAAAEGTCQTLQPDSCMRDEFDELGQATGKDEFPMIVPEYLLDDFMDKQEVIHNQVQFNKWLVKNLDALFGLWPIKIERTDENGQKHMVRFENLAEALAEIFGFLAQIAFDADTAVNVGVHATAEAVGARIAALQAGDYVKAIVDYLGFQKEQDSFDVQLSCTPGATGADGKLQESELKDFLKSSIQKVVGLNCKEKDDLHSILKRILFDSEISRAAFYKPLKADQVTGKMNLTGDSIRENKKKEQEQQKKEWEKFTDRIEDQTATPFDVKIVEKTNNTSNP